MTEPVSWPTVKRPLIAILRGIRPDEAESIVGALIDSGSSLYRPGMTAPEVRDRVLASVRAYDEALTEAA
jgi:2-dehydro-3-deoxyphosphogalactonate aldolase